MKPIKIAILSTFFLLASLVHAEQSIDVLVVKAPGVTSIQALGALQEINLLMDNSGLNGYDFANALGSGSVLPANECVGSVHTFLLACAMALGFERDAVNADIVILVVPSLAPTGPYPVCGAVPDLMINLPWITRWNHPLGFAVVATQCSIPGNFQLASHEVLHLLSIEHQDGDSDIDDPVRDNHGIALTTAATAGASPGDCSSGNCTVAVNRMSSPDGSNLPDGGPGGNSLHSNAKSVVSGKSWVEVANYRPKPQLSLPFGDVVWQWCVGWNAVHQVTWGGSTLYPGDSYEVEVLSEFYLWIPFHQGGAGSTTYVTKMPQTTFRVRIVSIGGVTVWVEFGTNENCMNPE